MEKIKPVPSNKNVGQVITGAFVFVILTIFPLYFNNYYYDILVVKYKFFCVSAILLLVCTMGYFIYLCCGSQDSPLNLKAYLSKFTFPEWCMIAFICINCISTLQSDYVYESFWGNEGRYSGLFLWLLYAGCFFVIVKVFNPKKWYLDAFLVVGVLACLFGITDYFKMDILGFKKDIVPGQYNMFASTIGNVNTYTSYVALVMGVSSTLYGTAKSWARVIFYYICMVISFFAIIMGLSDNSYLALGALFAVLPLYLFRTKTGVKRYACMVATFSVVIWIIDMINKVMGDRVLVMGGLLRAVSGFDKLELVVGILIALSAMIFVWNYTHAESKEIIGKKLVLIWLGILAAGAIILAYVIYDANWGGHGERYGALANYLIFDDEWGTHRGYNWRIGLESYQKFPLIHKLFGFGPDTYGILSKYGGYYDEMVRRYNEIFDSIHNEYLQFFVTVGPFGAAAYIGLLISSLTRMVRRAISNECVMAAAFGVICYAAQAVVNINLPIATPIMMVLLMIGLSGSRDI